MILCYVVMRHVLVCFIMLCNIMSHHVMCRITNLVYPVSFFPCNSIISYRQSRHPRLLLHSLLLLCQRHLFLLYLQRSTSSYTSRFLRHLDLNSRFHKGNKLLVKKGLCEDGHLIKKRKYHRVKNFITVNTDMTFWISNENKKNENKVEQIQ